MEAYFDTLDVDVTEGALLVNMMDNGDGEAGRERLRLPVFPNIWAAVAGDHVDVMSPGSVGLGVGAMAGMCVAMEFAREIDSKSTLAFYHSWFTQSNQK